MAGSGTGGDWDVVVVGGGIAGASIACELATDRRVCLLEAESTLAYHTTGRSAATFIESYGNAAIRALSAASRESFHNPPALFDSELAKPLGLVYVGGEGRADAVRSLYDEVAGLTPGMRLLDGPEAEALVPVLRPGWTELALLDPGVLDIDVHALLQGYVRGLRGRGGTVITSGGLVAARRGPGGWIMTDRAGGEHHAPVVVDAAGAWSDDVAALFGARPAGIVPLRRSVFMVDAPAGFDGDWPMIDDVDETFYVKPEPGQVLCSPTEQTPQRPGDAKPDELEIARALDAINEATLIGARHVRSAWAGLRSFAADRTPVVGFDPEVDGLFWYAGQGGYGIQTCPALARTGAALVRGEQLPPDIAAHGLQRAMLDPGRPGVAAAAG